MTQTARLYGGSLYELAAEEKLTDEIFGELKEIRTLFRENTDYVRLLAEPSIPKHERTDLIEKAFGDQVQRYLVNFLKMLCERGILQEFAGCCEEYTRRYHADHNITEAVVTSAVKLTESQLSALQEKLEKLSGKSVALVQKTDPTILGGLRVEMDGRLMDGTVAGRLSGISRKLNELTV